MRSDQVSSRPFWVTMAAVAAIYAVTPYMLIPGTSGTDGFRDLALLVGGMLIFGVETIVLLVVGVVLIAKKANRQAAMGLFAGIGVGLALGFASLIVIARLIL
ncbi:MAG: hypothetical protein WD208_13205 [Dehalococcoidia bacterium]